MKYYGVTSSMMVAIGYNPETEVLVVQFNEETYYRYDMVPAGLVPRIMFAPSIGKAFNKLIKDQRGALVGSYQKIDAATAAAL